MKKFRPNCKVCLSYKNCGFRLSNDTIGFCGDFRAKGEKK